MNNICESCKNYFIIKDRGFASKILYPCNSCKFNPFFMDYYDEALKPCPFCGSEAYITTDVLDNGDSSYAIECSNSSCEISMGWYNDKKEVIARWNTRAKI